MIYILITGLLFSQRKPVLWGLAFVMEPAFVKSLKLFFSFFFLRTSSATLKDRPSFLEIRTPVEQDLKQAAPIGPTWKRISTVPVPELSEKKN